MHGQQCRLWLLCFANDFVIDQQSVVGLSVLSGSQDMACGVHLHGAVLPFTSRMLVA
jgi:hypothetical protein